MDLYRNKTQGEDHQARLLDQGIWADVVKLVVKTAAGFQLVLLRLSGENYAQRYMLI